VTNSRGKQLGSVTMNDLIAAMVPPKSESTDQTEQ